MTSSKSDVSTTEAGYLGSLLATEGTDYFTSRRKLVPREAFTDQFTRNLFDAIVILHDSNESATPERVASFMVDRSMTGDLAGKANEFESVLQIVKFCLHRRAKTIETFRDYEDAINEQYLDYVASPEVIARLYEETEGEGTGRARLSAFKNSLERVIEQEGVVGSEYGWDEQQRLFTTIVEERRAQYGQVRFTTPVMWNLHHNIPVIRDGEMVIVSGPTGGGKTSLSHQWAEDAARTGARVLIVHLEDHISKLLQRQTCRWIGTTVKALEAGDQNDSMARMKELRQIWRELYGGSLSYRHLVGQTVSIIKQHIREWARYTDGSNRMVVLDYFGKIDPSDEVREYEGNLPMAHAKIAETLKGLAETLGIKLIVVSQESEDDSGKTRTQYTRSLEQKCQVWLSLSRLEAKEEIAETVNGKRIVLARPGENSPFVKLTIRKANDGIPGWRILYFEAPRFRAYDPKVMQAIRAGHISEDARIVWRALDEAELEHEDNLLVAWEQAADRDPNGIVKK